MLLLVIINLVVILFPEAYVFFSDSEAQAGPKIIRQFSELKENDQAVDSKSKAETDRGNYFKTSQPVKFFTFDPNTLQAEGWSMLGIKDRTISTIMRYLSKGGRFKKPDDLKKIWGIPKSLADTLIPYVRIKQFPVNDSANKISFYHHKKETRILELNSADSASLEALSGIGPTLAHRITAYRDKTRGFYEKEQLKEVWGIRDSVYEKIKDFFTVDEGAVKRLDINTAGFDELKSHPYFGYRIARAIDEFRKQHGKYNSLDDVQKIVSIDRETYKKISHYLTVNK